MIGTPEATRELRTLLAEIRRRDLLKRIAAIVGEPTPETHARDERIRREKRRAVQRRADPEPQERQRLATAAVRRDLAPLAPPERILRLRRADVLACARRPGRGDPLQGPQRRAHARARPLVPVRAPPRAGSRARRSPAADGAVLRRPRQRPRVGRRPPRRRREGGGVVRAMASAQRRSPLAAGRIAVGRGAYARGHAARPTHALLTGYVAMQLDETAVARRYLGLAAASYREQFGDRRSRQTRRDDPGWDAWVARLEADAALTGATARPDAATPTPDQPPPGAPPVP